MNRILFVDDELMILEGLRGVLRPWRRHWEMAFASSGEEALTLLAAAPFDVLVTDMRMPGMDGTELLQQVREHYPRIVRIVLSGHAERDSTLRCIAYAHQFLSKPCEAATLIDVLQRACHIQAMLSDRTLQYTIGEIDLLPPTPLALAALTMALDDSATSERQVLDIIARDVALTAKVLQLANSAIAGVGQPITDLKLAIHYLGIDVLRYLLLSAQAFQPQTGYAPEAEQGLRTLHRHSVLTAELARELMGPSPDADQAFAAGLLHDCGLLVHLYYLPDYLDRLLAACRELRRPLQEVEQELFGVHHAEMGGYLLGLWGLPVSMVEAVAHHHAPSALPHAGLGVVDAVHLADLVAQECQHVDFPESVSPDEAYEPAYLERLGIAENFPAWRQRTLAAHADGQDAVS